MTDKLDRRQVRTKRLLYDALMQLIEEKGLDHVTVTDVTSRAEVNRGTFYLHYRDVADMLQQRKDHVFDCFRQRVEQLDLKEASGYINRGEAYPKGVQLFEEIARHADFLRVMFGPKGDLSYAIRCRILLADHVYRKIQYAGAKNADMPTDYIVAYMSSANFGLIMHWLESGLNQTPAQMGNFMMRMMKYGPILSLGIQELQEAADGKPGE